jgi:hypothetical protein
LMPEAAPARGPTVPSAQASIAPMPTSMAVSDQASRPPAPRRPPVSAPL